MLLKKLRVWFIDSMRKPPSEEYADYLGFILAALALLILSLGVQLFGFELIYVRKFSGFASRWQALCARPDRVLLLSPALVWLALLGRKFCRSGKGYFNCMLVALVILVVSTVYILLDGAAFAEFYKTLP